MDLDNCESDCTCVIVVVVGGKEGIVKLLQLTSGKISSFFVEVALLSQTFLFKPNL